VAATVVGALGLAACSATPTGNSAKGTTSSEASTSTTALPETTTPTTAAGTSNLAVTDEIRSELVAAGAALNSLPPSSYTGLRPGETYYAIDSSTGTYWAGAGLVPSSSSTRAQVSVQDDGAYLLFERPRGGPWKAFDVGLAGTPDGTACPVVVPAGILRSWNWAPGSCRPSTLD
jgi:hypothetical protein